VTTFRNFVVTGKAVAVQPDGKIVVAASARFFALARYNSDGTLDSTFSVNGKVLTRDPKRGRVVHAEALALQPDGKIVVAGWDEEFDDCCDDRFALFRYRANGSLDRSFGGDGRVFTNVARGQDHAYAVVIRPNGKIVAAGTAVARRSVLLRYTGDGRLDRTFGGGDGVASASFLDGTGHEAAYDLAVQADGKFVAAGEISAGDEPFHPLALVRFTRSGALDQTFGPRGWALADAEDTALGVAIQSDGKIVAAGGPGFALARFTADGILDPSFDGDGLLQTGFPGFSQPFAQDVVLQPDGKIIACGGGGGDAGFLLARYEVADGSLDPSFGSNGTVVTPEFPYAFGLALQLDGKIVAVGHGLGSLAVARYLGG
jgi:uncharacterized delta-60 repeat protein